MIAGKSQQFLSADSVGKARVNELNCPSQVSNSLASTASLPDHMLTLKNRFVEMLPQNFQLKDGHVNRS